jgi:hypothetical protein
MADQANEKHKPAEKISSAEKGVSSAAASAAITDEQANKDHKEAKALAKPITPSGLFRQLTGNACAEFKLTGDHDLLSNVKKVLPPPAAFLLAAMTEHELVRLAKDDKMAQSFLKEIHRIKETRGDAAASEIDAALKNATKTFSPELKRLRAEQTSPVEQLEQRKDGSKTKPDDIKMLTEGMLSLAKFRHGTFAVDLLHIKDNEPGRAATATVIGPLASMMIGPVESERLGKRIILFGIAPVKGAIDEAIKQGTQNPAELVVKGICNFAAGVVIEYALTKLDPRVALAALGVAGGAVVVDQLATPRNIARNQKLMAINNRVDGMSDADFIKSFDESSQLLGHDVFEGGFAIATGGPGLPGGKVIMERFASKELRATMEMLSNGIAQVAKDLLPKFRPGMVTPEGVVIDDLTSFMSAAEQDGLGGAAGKIPKPDGVRLKMFKAAEKEAPPHEDWLKPFAENDPYRLERDLLGHSDRPPPHVYEEAMRIPGNRPSENFIKSAFRKLRETVLEGEAAFLKKEGTRIVPVREITDLGPFLYKDKDIPKLEETLRNAVNKEAKEEAQDALERAVLDNEGHARARAGLAGRKAVYDPNTNTIYVAELTGQARNEGMSLAYDLHHEIGHVIEQKVLKGENSLIHSREVKEAFNMDMSFRSSSENERLWETLRIESTSKTYKKEEVFADMYAHVIAELLSGQQNLAPGLYSRILRENFPNSLKQMREIVSHGLLKDILQLEHK